MRRTPRVRQPGTHAGAELTSGHPPCQQPSKPSKPSKPSRHSRHSKPSRRRILARTRLDFALDAAILAGYVMAYSFGFTGLAIHEWLGIGLGLVLLVHLTLHWDWVIRTTKRLLRRGGRDRLIWLVNLALIIAMTLVHRFRHPRSPASRSASLASTLPAAPSGASCTR